MAGLSLLTTDRCRYTREALAEQVKSLRAESPQELVAGAVVERGEGFRQEVRVGRRGGERNHAAPLPPQSAEPGAPADVTSMSSSRHDA